MTGASGDRTGPDRTAAGRAGLASARTSRPHRAARLEDRLARWLARVLRGRGWVVRLEPYVGYGTQTWVRVMARALLTAPVVTDADLPGAGAPTQAGTRRPVKAVRGWRSFATAQLPGAVVKASIGGAEHDVVADRSGYIDVVLPCSLPPGWHDVELVSQDGRTSRVPVLVLGPTTRTILVSDIDDTVMVTRLPRPFVAAWNSFVRHESAREPVVGMAAFYRAIVADRDVPVIYLSTGAWNAAPAIGRFLRRHGYPTGPMLLTDFGPTNTGWFRSGREHKRAALRRLLAELPDVRLVLVGDDGQRDPEIYGELVREYPDRVHSVVIRQLTGAEHVLAHGVPAPARQGEDATDATNRRGVPVVQGRDGPELLTAWTRADLDLD